MTTDNRQLTTILALILGVAPAQAQVKLEWQFQQGETFLVERIYSQKQTVEIKSKQFKEQRTKTWLTAVTVKEKTQAGAVLDLKTVSIQLQSAGTAASGGFDDKMAAKMKGTRFTATVTAQGKLTKFEGYDAFIQKLADKNEEVEKVLRALLSEEALREDVEDIFHFLPGKAVRKGDKWKREANEPVPPFGSFQSSLEYVLEQDLGKELVIAFKTQMSYKAPADGDLFRVIKGSLRAEEGQGTIRFNVNKGCLIRSEKTVRIRGDLVIETMGNQTRLEFASDNSLRVRVLPGTEAIKE